jgi:hypothetical protein
MEQLQEIDRPRLARQLDKIRDVMLLAAKVGQWMTLADLEKHTGYPAASISAQLRHLRKPANGGYTVEKRPRGDRARGLWEYRIEAPQ